MWHVIGLRALDWAIISLSLFNLIALLWLGLTVLLNAERRTAGTWLAGGGLIVCGLFFVGHTAVVGREVGGFDVEMGFWWRVSWLMTIGAPILWYLGTVWYTGVLSTLRHRIVLTALSGLGLIAAALLVFNPLPSYQHIAERAPVELLSIAGVPLVAVAYPLYGLLCFGASIGALYNPEASERFMGDLARRRARPWLVSASLLLIAICVAFGAIMTWFLRRVVAQPEALYFLRQLPLFMAFDLLLLVLVAAGVVLTGQAIVSYEIFTGKTLPRGGLRRYWRRSLVLAAGYGALLGMSLSLPNIDPITRILLATVLMTLFYALLTWRSYAEREQSIERLRPFVGSQRLYEQLLHPTSDHHAIATIPFTALCAEVLGARTAYLAPLGSVAALSSTTLSYPGDAAAPPLNGLAHELRSSSRLCVALDPRSYGGAVWAVPLRSERHVIGALLLGPKHDGNLYTQEEIEFARTTGERLLDTQASVELAHRLMALQRQRLAETQVIDNRARRTLHDEILPRLHAAMLIVGRGELALAFADRAAHDPASAPPQAEALTLLADVHREIANLLHELPPTASADIARRGLIGALRQVVQTDAGNAFDDVQWRIEPTAERATHALPDLTAEVMLFAAREAIRNAARHGRSDPAHPLILTIEIIWRDGLLITIADDGVGFAGSRPANTGGAGQGLALHSTMMAVVGGVLTTERIGERTAVTLMLPQAVCAGVAPLLT
jgi:signal transduction histidine kinase